MDRTYWHKQTTKPLFPDIHWSKPENKNQAGKLLIIGGNLHGFNAPAEAFTISTKEGIGAVKVLLPDKIKKQLEKFPKSSLDVYFAPSTISGSFAKNALPEIIDLSLWADGVLIAGDLGHNSETSILLENYISKYTGILMLTKDAVDYFIDNPANIFHRSNTAMILTIAQLQKVGLKLKYKTPFKFSMNIIQLVEALHEFSLEYSCTLIIKHLNIIYIASKGMVSTSEAQDEELEMWRIPVASKAIVWWIQNPNKPYEAITSSLVD